MPRLRRTKEELRQHAAAVELLQQQHRASRRSARQTTIDSRTSTAQTLLPRGSTITTTTTTTVPTTALAVQDHFIRASSHHQVYQQPTTLGVEVMSYGRSNQVGGNNPHGLHKQVPPINLSSLTYGQQAVSSQQQRGYTAAVASVAGLTIPYSAAAAAALSAQQQQQQQLAATYPINPDVKLKKLPFYDILAELLKPASLAPQGSGRYQESAFSFSLTPQQANKIANSRDLRPGKQDYNVQVQMRFCLLETSCEQEDNFPPNIAVKINDKMCPLPSPIPTNKPGVEPKRPSRPVNITALCRISPTVTNRVLVSWASEYGRCYVISVYLVQKLSSDDLLHRLKSKGVRIADFTRSLIKQKLNEDADCEIATTSLRCSLMCPLGKMRMLLPCRANTCNHLQCFDASLYLQMNERKPTWTCPVCDKPAIYDTLVIDGYFQDVLRLNTTSNEVTLHKDGSWSPLMPKKERPEPEAEKRKSVVAIETLSDSDDDSPADGDKVLIDDSVVEEVPSGGAAPSKKALDVECITLESSSDEDDDDDSNDGESNPPPAKRPYNPAQASSGATNGDTQQDVASQQPAVVSAIPPADAAADAAAAAAAATAAATAGGAAADGAATEAVNGAEGAKTDESWSVGTVDPGKRLVFSRKSMSCSSNGTSATTTATANGGSTTTTTCVVLASTATANDPLALTPTPPPTTTESGLVGSKDDSSDDDCMVISDSSSSSGDDSKSSSDDDDQSSSDDSSSSDDGSSAKAGSSSTSAAADDSAAQSAAACDRQTSVIIEPTRTVAEPAEAVSSAAIVVGSSSINAHFSFPALPDGLSVTSVVGKPVSSTPPPTPHTSATITPIPAVFNTVPAAAPLLLHTVAPVSVVPTISGAPYTLVVPAQSVVPPQSPCLPDLLGVNPTQLQVLNPLTLLPPTTTPTPSSSASNSSTLNFYFGSGPQL